METISLITEAGIEEFIKKDFSNWDTFSKGMKILVKTEDEKEFLGIYITFDNKWQSIKLKSETDEIIINIPLRKITEIYLKIG